MAVVDGTEDRNTFAHGTHADVGCSRADSGGKAMSRAAAVGRIFPRSGYDALRIVSAVALLVAAALKPHQLATEPVIGSGFLHTRPLVIAVVEFELFFGLWLLAGIWPAQARLAALCCFTLFGGVALWKALSGHGSCDCFPPRAPEFVAREHYGFRHRILALVLAN